MITIKNKLSNREVPYLIEMFYQVCKSEPNLSQRSKYELKRAYYEGRILIAVDKSDVVGWLMILPYTNRVQELAAAFVFEPYRSKRVFTKLLSYAIKKAEVSIIVTFNRRFASKLKYNFGFRNSSVWDAIKITNGRFLLNRLNFQRLLAIKNHYRVSNPSYLIFKHND